MMVLSIAKLGENLVNEDAGIVKGSFIAVSDGAGGDYDPRGVFLR